jgi:hypothetical protein
VNAFNKLISTLPVLTTDEEVLGRLLWNAALEEAAKAADEMETDAARFTKTPINPLSGMIEGERKSTANDLARAIRAMQTTAGAAGGEGK